MAHAGDDGNYRCEDSAGNGLFIEGPQLLGGAAASRHDDDVDSGLGVEAGEGRHNTGDSVGALDGRWREDKLGQRPATAEDVLDVVEDGAGLRSDDADAAWE